MNLKSCELKEILKSCGLKECQNEEEYYKKNMFFESGFEEKEEFKIIWVVEEDGINKEYYIWFNEHNLKMSGVEY